MAISNLVSPGQSSERPSVSAFFGQSYTAGATQKVSSTMMSDSFVDSTMNMLKGLNNEIARIQATAKKTLAGFDKVINSIRELNRSITMRFRTLNNELTASRVDFLRGVLNAPEMPAPDLGGAPILVMKNDQPATEPPKKDPEKAPSLLDMLMSAAGEAVLGQAITKIFTSGGTIVKTLISALVPLIFNPGTLGAAGFIALAYFAGKARAENPEGFLEFMRKVNSGAARAEQITGGNDQNAPNPNADISRKRLSPPEFLKQQGVISSIGDAEKVVEKIKGSIVTLKDGRWFDNTKSTKIEPAETHPDYVEPGYTTPSGNLLKEPQTPAQKSQANRTKAAAPVATAPAPATPPAASAKPPTDSGGANEGEAKGAPTRGSLKGALNKSLPIKDQGGDADPDQQGMQPDIVAEKPTKLSMSAENPKNNLLSVDSVERMMDTKVIQMAETVRMQSTNRTGAINQPIVMNNSSTTNSSSSSGGEGNNVSGQNFPLTAINPHIQEFLQKQNMQYQ